MQLEIKRIAGICVFLAAAISVSAQQNHPPKTSKTVTVKKTVVPAKTAPPKGVVVIKKTVTTKTTTTKTVAAKAARQAAPTSHRVAKRRVRKHVRYARRRSHHYRRVVHRTTTHSVVASTVETGLVGVHLFDSGIKVLGMYGNPNFILNLGENPSTAAPGPAAGGGGTGFGGGGGGAPGLRGGFGGGPAMGRGGGGGNRPTGRPSLGDNPPDGGLSDPNSDLQGPAFAGRFGGRLGGGGQGPGPGGQFGQGPNAGGGPGAGAPAPTYIQWIYKEGAAQYKFIIDQHDRVVQIEAIGMDDPKVRTSHGITFGATFKTLVDHYGIPDAYEISGDNLVLRYLNKYHVAFRLNRLETNQPHEVTAIVVSGGKG